MISSRIGLVFDCDGTIAEDSTTRLLRYLKINEKGFWAKVRQMESKGWEPTLAYMKLLIDFAHRRDGRSITANTFRQVGRKFQLSKGIPSFFREMKHYVARKYSEYGISLGIYVISGGIEEIIKASRMNKAFAGGRFVDDIFGCRFSYDANGVISFPACIVSYTEKTKYIFAINKGLTSRELGKDPYCVNDHILEHERPVQLHNMIYIGDGPTDVACMSLLKRLGFEIFAVYTPPRRGIPRKTHELAKQGRFTRGPYKRDYSRNSELRRTLETEIDGYAERIIGEKKAKRRPAPRH